MATRRPKGTGKVRRLPSGRWQARFREHPAPCTFDTKVDALAWLDRQVWSASQGVWTPPSAVTPSTTLAVYAEGWLSGRDLTPRTRALYRGLLDRHILPELGSLRLDDLGSFVVRRWHERTALDTPTTRAHAYSLLRAILHTAVSDDVITTNPCRVRGAGAVRRASTPTFLTSAELKDFAARMPEPLDLAVLLAAWCALRIGEFTELRAGDLNLTTGTVHVRRAVTWVKGEPIIGPPKTAKSVRDVAIPPHLLPALRVHVDGLNGDDLLFPGTGGGNLTHSQFYKPFKRARSAAGRPNLRPHDLRHTGGMLATQTGASLPEVMGRLGHTTVAAAMLYQHVAAGADAVVAQRLSDLA